MADHHLRQGDDSASLSTTLLDAAGDPVDIAGAEIHVEVAPIMGGPWMFGGGMTPQVANNDQNGDGSDGTLGQVSFDWPGVVEDAGYFSVNWEAVFQNGATQTFPNDGSELLYVSADTPQTVSDALATTEDLQARLGIEFTAAEHVRARELLELSSALIRREAGQHISLVEDDVLTIRGTDTQRLRLPERPVGDVTSVTLDGTVIDALGYYVSGDELVRFGWGSTAFGSPLFGYPSQELVITYTHGYAAGDIPGEVVAICLEAVVRVWVNPGAVVSESIGSVQTTYSVSAVPGLMLTEDERQALNRVLGRSIGQVQLR